MSHTFPPALHDGSRSDPHPTPLALTLRGIASWLESHPEVERPYIHGLGGSKFTVRVMGLDAERMGALVRRLGGNWSKHGDDHFFWMDQQIMPGVTLELGGYRSSVCERVVVGTEEVEVPDPDAPMVTQVVEKVEWRCGSLLGGTE